jgi:hypothetical protein
MSFPKLRQFNTHSGKTASQRDLCILGSFFSYTDSKRACALCGEIKNNRYQRRPADSTEVKISPTRRASCSAVLQINGCEHVFHPTCLLSWLEEGISGDVSSSGRVERVPAEMRSMVPAAGCAICGAVQGLVGEAGLSGSGLAEWADRIFFQRFEEWKAKERTKAEELGGGVPESER